MSFLQRSRIAALALLLSLVWLATARAGSGGIEQVEKFVPTGAMSGDEIGSSVCLVGDIALVATPDDDSNTGAVFSFRFDGSAWIEQKLTASDATAGDQFGFVVAMHGDVALIGTRGAGGNGAAYVFRFDGSAWSEEQKLTASDGMAGDSFGSAVALHASVALIGAEGDDALTGSAYVFGFDGSTWTEQQKLTASDGASGAAFGGAVAVHGSRALIGAETANGADVLSGAAYAFDFDGSVWVEQQRLVASDGAFLDLYGNSVALHGDVAVVGAPNDDGATGSSYAYRHDGSSWIDEQKLRGFDTTGGDSFGRSVSVQDDRILSGSVGDDGNTGSAYLFRFDGSDWSEFTKITADDRASSDRFGSAVCLDGTRLLIGAPGDESQRGASYVFDQLTCLPGTVNAGAGARMDALFVNGSSGGDDRVVQASIGEHSWIVVSVVKPPAGGNGRFVLHVTEGAPNPLLQSTLPFDVGRTCFPFLLNQGAAPVIVANNIGKESAVGASNYYGDPVADPERATTSFLYPPMPLGTVLTLQSIVIDPSSPSPKSASVSNAVVFEVVP